MREIEFRAKRKDNGEWVCGGVLVFPDEGKCYIAYGTRYIPDTRDWDEAEYYESNPVYTMTQVEVIPETVGQFAGLKDKNGTKIFEGDVVMEKAFSWRKEEHHLVRWELNSCGFEPFSDSNENCGHCGGGLDPEFCEVIGNIHDNPELLEVSDGR